MGQVPGDKGAIEEFDRKKEFSMFDFFLIIIGLGIGLAGGGNGGSQATTTIATQAEPARD